MPIPLIALLLVQDVPQPQYPSHYGAVEMTCPVGGETFQGPSLMHYSTFGSMPDGMPLGSIAFPTLLPECPSNGLPFFQEFDEAQVAALAPLLASAEWQQEHRSETPYHRAYWLASRIGEERSALWLLLTASWEAKNADEAERAERYQSAFVEQVLALPADADDMEIVALRVRAANALRELGRFEEAEALRSAIVIGPNAGAGDTRAQQNRENWQTLIDGLATAIARRDASRFPIDLMAKRQAAFRCIAPERSDLGDVPPLSAFEREYCASPEMAGEVKTARERAAAISRTAKP